jgi:putative flavoprotein involved in K+ transport
MANYLVDYAWRFGLPVRNEVRVERLSRVGDRYLVSAGDLHFEAEHVVVAMANYQKPVAPPSPPISIPISFSFIRASTAIRLN